MYCLLYIYKSFSITPDNLIKAWGKHQEMKELEKLENITKWNGSTEYEIEKVNQSK